MPFIHEDFLLQNATARHLYHKFAAGQPILDFHSHLSAADIAANRQFRNLFEIWLEGDHYKWRAMRANGIAETFCAGEASPYDKFLAWASTIPHCLRNPLYQWTHLELQRYFGVDELLDEGSAPDIWQHANELLETPELSTQGILAKFCVRALCTTNDPTDDLQPHAQIAAAHLPTRVYPTFRPDRALDVHLPTAFNPWVERLAAAANVHIRSFPDFLDALRKRHDFFHQAGCRLSDHGLVHCYANFCSESRARAIFDQARTGQAATHEEHAEFASHLMLYFGHLDAQSGWTKQLHLGALRNVNSRALQSLGPDTGFDSIVDFPQAASLGAYLNQLNRENALPKMILYNLNPGDNYIFATMAGNFQDGSIPGKIQFGSGWWFLDQKEGIEWQLNALSNVGLLPRFVGMLTDSRSFMSFPRHEYFRRVLCNLLGRDIERGELPDREDLVGPMIENICYHNAARFLGLTIS
jgi:glucuronate isomerase